MVLRGRYCDSSNDGLSGDTVEHSTDTKGESAGGSHLDVAVVSPSLAPRVTDDEIVQA